MNYKKNLFNFIIEEDINDQIKAVENNFDSELLFIKNEFRLSFIEKKLKHYQHLESISQGLINSIQLKEEICEKNNKQYYPLNEVLEFNVETFTSIIKYLEYSLEKEKQNDNNRLKKEIDNSKTQNKKQSTQDKIQWQGKQKELTELFLILEKEKKLSPKQSEKLWATISAHFENADGTPMKNTTLEQVDRKVHTKEGGKAKMKLDTFTDQVKKTIKKGNAQ